jgi:hypothetical protein
MGGGIFEALLHYSFLKAKYILNRYHTLAVVLVLLLVAGRAAAFPEGKMTTVTRDTIICWADSDGCYNYILQASADGTGNVLRKANGKRLRAGNRYFHTPYDITKDPNGDAALQQLLEQEKSSLWRDLLRHWPQLSLTALILLAALPIYFIHRRHIARRFYGYKKYND